MRCRVSASSSRHLEARRHAGVRHPAAAAARRGADADAPARRQALAEAQEACRNVDHLADVAALDQAVALEHRPVGGGRAGERGGVRGGGARARIRLADLVDDDGLAGLQRLLGHAPEGLRALDVLQQHQQGVGLALLEDPVGEIERLQARLVAGGDDVAHRELLGAGVVEEGKADAAALADDGELPARGAHGQQRPVGGFRGRAEGRAQGGGRIGEALRVGPHHRHVVALGDGADLALHAGACFVARGFRETRAQHDRRAHARFAAALEFLRHMLGGDDDDGEIGRLRQVGDGSVGLEAHHLGLAAADGIEGARIRVALHHLQDAAAQAMRVGGRPDQRHAARPKQGADVGHMDEAPRDGPSH